MAAMLSVQNSKKRKWKIDNEITYIVTIWQHFYIPTQFTSFSRYVLHLHKQSL